MRKLLFTLNINYPTEITNITFPNHQATAARHGWEWMEITERKYPDWPVCYEKFQIYDHEWDWAIFIDADAVIHPRAQDWTELSPDAVRCAAMLNHQIQWINRPKVAFPTYFVVAPSACREVWRPLDITPTELLAQWLPPAFPDSVPASYSGGLFADDYACAMNCERFGYRIEKIRPVKITLTTLTTALIDEQVFHQQWVPAQTKALDLEEWINWQNRQAPLPERLLIQQMNPDTVRNLLRVKPV